MHAVYLSVANISKNVRKNISSGATILLAEIPSYKFPLATKGLKKSVAKKRGAHLNRVLWHKCMKQVLAPLLAHQPSLAPSCLRPMLDATGYKRLCFPVLMAWCADLEEQSDILGLSRSECPKCLAGFAELDAPHVCEPRTAEWIQAQLREIREELGPDADCWSFKSRAKTVGLNGVEELCWEGQPMDISRVICVDSLHFFHKWFGDHMMAWLTRTVGQPDLDARFIAQPRQIGARNFSTGISRLSQLAGREHKDMQRHILQVVAGHPNASPGVLKSLRAVLDFIQKAQFPLHTDRSLDEMEHDLQAFVANRHVFIQNGSRSTNPQKKFVAHMKIPKSHYWDHSRKNIEDLGTVDNYSTETSERLHIPTCKESYKATNRHQGYRQQIINRLIQNESLSLFSNYVCYRLRKRPDISSSDYADLLSHLDLDVDSSINDPVKLTKAITLAKRPHRAKVSLDSLIDQFDSLDIISPILRYFLDGDDGSSRRINRAYYERAAVPYGLEVFDIWHSFKLDFPPPNAFYSAQSRTIHCKPPLRSNTAVYETVLVEMENNRTDIKRTFIYLINVNVSWPQMKVFRFSCGSGLFRIQSQAAAFNS